MNNLVNGECLEYIRNLPDNCVDLIFTDPPYALGSEIIIRQDGKPDYKKAMDFMNKWDMPDGKFWQEWYKEAFRVLKYGGHCAMFGIDRQTFLFQYYAVLNGFQPKQSLYWYFISNFPKSSDLSKMIDKRFGLEREVVGKNQYANRRPNKEYQHKQDWGNTLGGSDTANITAPNHPLAQKYNGLKYSVAPLKQTLEEVMVYQKDLTFQQGYCIVLVETIKQLLLCITTKIKSKEQGLTTLVSSVEKNFTYHQVEKYLKNGSLIAQINAGLIEEMNVNNVENISIALLHKLVNTVVKPVILSLCKDLEAQTTHNGLVEDLKEKMDILLSETQKTHSNMSLSIELLWLIILVENLELMKMSTISTNNEMITELKTLNYYHTENIKHFTELKNQKIEPLQRSVADIVANNFLNEIAKLKLLKDIFVVKNTGTNLLQENKQTCEEIMVFQKPYKHGSCLNDVLAYEEGDETITVGALDIEGNRCEVSEEDYKKSGRPNFDGTTKKTNGKSDFGTTYMRGGFSTNGRYPAQTFIDSGTAEVLDRQSGILKSGGGDKRSFKTDFSNTFNLSGQKDKVPFKKYNPDSGGCSRILHKCDYEDKDFDLFKYCPKVSKSERNEGLDNSMSILYDFNICQKENNSISLVKDLQLQMGMDKLAQKGTEEFGQQKKKDMLWSIDMFGKRLMEKFLMDCISTTKTITNSTIDLTTWNWLTPLFTNGYIQGVNLEMMDGINLALSVDSSYTNQIITEIQKQGGFNPSVNLAELNKPLLIKGKLKLENLTNFHCTVKPTKLLTHILKLFKTPNQQTILDPFMGSGSMGISAVECGYNYIGIELDKDYFEIAKARINNVEKQKEIMIL